jgi:hypothetical protein
MTRISVMTKIITAQRINLDKLHRIIDKHRGTVTSEFQTQ